MKDKSPVLILDGMNFAYTAFYAHHGLRYHGKPTSIIFGMPKQVVSCIKTYHPEKVYIVWDGDRHPKRLELCPGYKGHREERKTDEMKESVLKQCKAVKKLFRHMGIAQVYNAAVEGDDMIYLLTKRLQKKDKHIVICSGDKDMEQLVKKGTEVFNIRTKETLADGIMFEAYRTIKPKQVPDFISLTGDKSDDIPGYHGIGGIKAIKFLGMFGSIENFLSNPKNKFSGIDHEILRKLYEVNKYMINLELFNKKYNKGVKVEYLNKKREPNEEKFYQFCMKYGLKSFLLKNFKETIFKTESI